MSPATSVTRGPGLYGKLPARGDFLARRLPATFIEPYDAWIAASLAASREQLGERWLETYLTSPIWHFALSPGAAGDAAMVGVMIPSVDAAGRYFPFSIAASLATLAADEAPAGAPPDELSTGAGEAPDEANRPAPLLPQIEDVLRGALDEWLAEAERLALLGLGEALDLDAYDAAIAAIAPPARDTLAGPAQTLLGEPGVAARNAWRFGGAGGAALGHVAPEMLAALLGHGFGRYSVWWTEGSQAMAPSRLVCEGLPAPERFVSMLDGGYATRGWQDRPSPLLQVAAPAPVPEADAPTSDEHDDESDTVVNDATPEPEPDADEALPGDDGSDVALPTGFDPWTIPAPRPRRRGENDTARQPRRSEDAPDG